MILGLCSASSATSLRNWSAHLVSREVNPKVSSLWHSYCCSLILYYYYSGNLLNGLHVGQLILIYYSSSIVNSGGTEYSRTLLTNARYANLKWSLVTPWLFRRWMLHKAPIAAAFLWLTNEFKDNSQSIFSIIHPRSLVSSNDWIISPDGKHRPQREMKPWPK